MIPQRPEFITCSIHITYQVFPAVCIRFKNPVRSFLVPGQLVKANIAAAENADGEDAQKPFHPLFIVT